MTLLDLFCNRMGVKIELIFPASYFTAIVPSRIAFYLCLSIMLIHNFVVNMRLITREIKFWGVNS